MTYEKDTLQEGSTAAIFISVVKFCNRMETGLKESENRIRCDVDNYPRPVEQNNSLAAGLAFLGIKYHWLSSVETCCIFAFWFLSP